jgi:N-succinyl-L-ornithine transcarbamylase
MRNEMSPTSKHLRHFTCVGDIDGTNVNVPQGAPNQASSHISSQTSGQISGQISGQTSGLGGWINDALAVKAQPFGSPLGSPLGTPLAGERKTLGLLFFNASLRTRVSTQRAARNLGMDVFVVNVGTESWKLEFTDGAVMDGDTVEHIREGAAVLGRYCDVLGVRAFAGLTDRAADYAETTLNAIIRHAGVPVVSLESATRHPLQSFADVITMTELWQQRTQHESHEQHERRQSSRLPKIAMTWAPHPKALPQAVPNSFAEWTRAWCEHLNASANANANANAGTSQHAEFVIAHPEGFELADEFTRGVRVTHDQREALHDADFVYVKNWSPYREDRYGAALGENWRDYADWTVNAASLQSAGKSAGVRVLHCLPTRRNVELADDVLDSPHSAVIDEAANRIVSAQTVLKHILENQL